MSVIPLTLFFSLLLAGLFIALFAHEQRRRRFASAERDSLLPLADEQSHVTPSDPLAGHSRSHEDGDDQAHGHGPGHAPGHGAHAHHEGRDHHQACG